MEREGKQGFMKPENRIEKHWTRASTVFSDFKNVCFYVK